MLCVCVPHRCLFELATKLGAPGGARLIVELRPDDRRELQRLLETEVGTMASILTAVDVNDAQVSKPRDREFIVGRIEAAGGFDGVNRLVKAALREWLSGAAREAVREAEARAAGGEGEAPLALMHGLAGLCVAAWLIGLCGSDRWMLTQWASWLPAILLLPIGLVLLCCSRSRHGRITWSVIALTGTGWWFIIDQPWRPAPP